MSYKLTIWQNNEKEIIEVDKGKYLLKVLFDHGYEINSYCGGQGICGKCKIKLIKGEDNITLEEQELLDKQELADGIRLACLTEINSDMEVKVKKSDDIEILTTGLVTETALNPEYKKELVTIDQPSLEDQRDFTSRIFSKLSLDDTLYDGLLDFNQLDKKSDITVTSCNKKIIRMEAGDTTDKLYGIAIDIGTTTVVLYLMDLNTGEEVDVYSLYNPQKKYGADVISRINYSVQNEDGVKNLKSDLIDGINNAIEEMTKDNEIDRADIMMVTVVGNTIMMHTLLGLETASIARTPYVPLVTSELKISPLELGIKINDRGSIHILPSVSGYVGADIIGDMLTAGFYKPAQGNDLLIDIGTNGEMVLRAGEKIYTCSTAAGPAFEGANITFGMAGLPGAISSCKLNAGKFPEIKTIKEQEAEGICGSGLLDIVAELYTQGIINKGGAFVKEEEMDPETKKRITEYKGKKAYRITDRKENNILLTQKDVRELQLAKGAIQSGIKILMKEVGITYQDIDNIFIAGGFGNYIDPHNACVIGLIPAELEERIVRIGNGAGMGAKIYLLDKDTKNKAEIIKDKVKYIELSTRKDFQKEFMESMYF